MAQIEPPAFSIQPGVAIGELQLDQPHDDALALMPQPYTFENRGGCLVYLHADVSIFVEGGVVTQVGVHGAHPATGPGGLKIGAALSDLGDVLDQMTLDVHDAVLLLEEFPGLCFWVVADGLDLEGFEEEDGEATITGAATVDWIGVFPPESPESRNPRIPVRLL